MHTASLPALDTSFRLDGAQVAAFRANGHTLTRNVLTAAEATAYRAVIHRAAYRHNTEKRALEERDTYGRAFLQIMNLWEVDADVRQFTLARRFAKMAAELLGVERVRLYHDQALYKEPGGGFTPWHQDQYYWPLDTDATVTLWMPLVPITEEMGMLTFASGSHRSGFVENIAISDESEKKLEQYIRDRGFAISRPAAMAAGDATWHYGWTLHSAPGNASGQTREVMTVIYFADGARVTAPQNEHQEADRQRWLGGAAPGSRAASALNPVVGAP